MTKATTKEEEKKLREIFCTQEKVFDHLYSCLNILDGKASTLLTFNAIGLTAIAIWLQYVPANLLHLFLDCIFLFLLISCGLSLYVVSLHWSSPEELDQVDKQIRVLLTKRNVRTRCYKMAWCLSILSVLVLFLVAGFHTIGTYLTVSDSCGPTCEAIFGEKVFGNVDQK